MKSHKLIALLVAMLILSVSLAGCSGKSNQALIVAQGVDPTTLDPGMHAETPTGNVERQIFDTLIRLDDQMEFQPAIATSWTSVDDNTWQFEIRSGVKFHDGTDLTAEDVKYSLDRIADPAKKSPQASNFSAIKEVTVLDKQRLQITTKLPYPILPARLAGLRVVPQHYLEQVGDQRFSQEPIGSGPYRFKKWIKDDSVTLEAYEQYWGGVPKIKQVVFKPIPEAASRVMALEAGEVDIAVNIPPDQMAAVNGSKRAATATVPSSRIIFAQLETSKGPLADPRVRQAVNYAVDVDEIVNSLLGGNGVPMSLPLSSMDFGYDPAYKPYGYDPEKAKQLLSDAGYADGLTLKFLAPSGRYMMDKEVAEAIKSQLQAVGVDVKLQVLEWGVYVSQIMSRTLDADLWLLGWGSSLFDADGTLYSFFRTGERFCYYDVSAERNQAMDALLDKARTSLGAAERLAAYTEALAYLREDAPWLMLYQQKDIYGVSSRVNWSPRPDEAIIISAASWK